MLMLDCCTEVENGNGCDYAGRLVVVGCESVTRLADCVAGRNRESVTKRVARMEKQQKSKAVLRLASIFQFHYFNTN